MSFGSALSLEFPLRSFPLQWYASFDEVIIAIFLAGRRTATLPKRMWDSVLLETDPTIAAISPMLIFLTIVVLASRHFAAGAQDRSAKVNLGGESP